MTALVSRRLFLVDNSHDGTIIVDITAHVVSIQFLRHDTGSILMMFFFSQIFGRCKNAHLSCKGLDPETPWFAWFACEIQGDLAARLRPRAFISLTLRPFSSWTCDKHSGAQHAIGVIIGKQGQHGGVRGAQSYQNRCRNFFTIERGLQRLRST